MTPARPSIRPARVFGVPAALAGLGSAARDKLALWWRNARTRDHLTRLPPHLLADVGLTPRQARTEAARAFWR
jgi:uncharacterized protein YjiS (DUF1127 family)